MITQFYYISETKTFSNGVGKWALSGGINAGFAAWELSRLNKDKAQSRISNKLMKNNPDMTAEEARDKARKKKLHRDIGLTALSAGAGALISGMAKNEFNKKRNK